MRQRFWGTWGLVGINCGVFLFLEGWLLYGWTMVDWGMQRLGDRMLPDLSGFLLRYASWVMLVVLNGSLEPSSVLMGEWWRCWTAIFLHAGWFHLFSNMVALWILGRLVERYLGTMRYLAAYLLTGVGSMVAVTLVALWLNKLSEVTVGASGGIMGLLGVLLMLCVWDWWRVRSPISMRRVRSLVLVLVAQLLVDQLMPRVSVVGHLSGLGLGILVGALLGWRDKRRL